jgi:hypothetical protein
MSATARTWSILAALYVAFFSWYTSFGGPLEPDEIDAYLAILAERSDDPKALEHWKSFMETDTGDDFVMFNAIELRETPLQVEGVEPDETSEQVLARYTTPFLGLALRSAAHPVFMGRAASGTLDLWGIEGAEQWSIGGLVRYRSRRDLMEQVKRVVAAGEEIHVFKVAAISKTIAYPLDPFFQLGDPRLVFALLLAVVGSALQARKARQPVAS